MNDLQGKRAPEDTGFVHFADESPEGKKERDREAVEEGKGSGGAPASPCALENRQEEGLQVN